MKIREYKAQDHLRVTELWLRSAIELNSSDSLVELAKAQLLNPGLFLIAEDQNQICGAVLGLFNGRRGWVNHLAVSPDHQGQGIGAKLLATLEQRLAARGCPRLNLHIELSNAGVQRFYEKQGYQQYDVIYMYKLLR